MESNQEGNWLDVDWGSPRFGKHLSLLDEPLARASRHQMTGSRKSTWNWCGMHYWTIGSSLSWFLQRSADGKQGKEWLLKCLSVSPLWQDIQINCQTDCRRATVETSLGPTRPGHGIRGFEPDGIETKERWVSTSGPRGGGLGGKARGPQSLVRFGTNMY